MDWLRSALRKNTSPHLLSQPLLYCDVLEQENQIRRKIDS